MKKLIFFFNDTATTENPWDWFLKVIVPFYFGSALIGMAVLIYFY